MDSVKPSAATGQQRAWADLRAINLLRWALCVLMISLALMDEPDRILRGVMPALLAPVAALFLLSSITFSIMLVLRQPYLTTQITVQAWADVLLLVALLYATGGVTSGLSVLMVTAVIGIGTLLSRKMMVALTTFAILAMGIEEGLREFQGLSPGSDFTRTGVLSALMLLGSFASNTMAMRVRETADLAKQKLLDLANMEQLNERILRHMSAGVLVVDHNSHIRLYNEAARAQLGLPANAQDQPLSSLCPELAGVWRDWTLSNENEGDGAAVNRNKNQLQPHFLKLGEYEPAATLIFLEDMDVLHHRSQQIKQAALGRLTASIAHEIRNPLSAIAHASQLLGEWRNSPLEEAQLLKIIDKHCGRIDRIVGDVLSLSKQRDIHPISIQLREWLEKQAQDYHSSKPENPVILDFSAVPNDIRVRFDPMHLQQIMTNLWDNAGRYAKQTGEEPRVQHRAWHLPNLNTTHLDVKDNGPGIPAKEIHQVFEPFFTTESSGTGLGLYIVRELCECNHAHIELRQVPEMGACFQLSFMETWQQAPQ